MGLVWFGLGVVGIAFHSDTRRAGKEEGMIGAGNLELVLLLAVMATGKPHPTGTGEPTGALAFTGTGTSDMGTNQFLDFCSLFLLFIHLFFFGLTVACDMVINCNIS